MLFRSIQIRDAPAGGGPSDRDTVSETRRCVAIFVWPTVNPISNFRRSYEAIWRHSGKVLTIVCAPARQSVGNRCNLNFKPHWNQAATLAQPFVGAAYPPGALTLSPRSCVQSRARGPGSLSRKSGPHPAKRQTRAVMGRSVPFSSVWTP